MIAGNLNIIPVHPNPDCAVTMGRCSTGIQVEGTSLGTQKAGTAAWAERKGLAVVCHIEEDGISGKRYLTRPDLLRALNIIERKLARYLVCETADRSARTMRVGWQICERVWAAGGVMVCNGVELDGSDAHGRFIASIFFGLAEWDYANTVGKLGKGRRAAALGGKATNPYRMAMQRGTAAYGLIIPTDADVRATDYAAAVFPKELLGRHVIIKGNAEQARRLELVRELFARYDSGWWLFRLIAWLKAMGVKSPRGHEEWAHSALDYLLRNEVYSGAGNMFMTAGGFDEARELERGLKHAAYRLPIGREEWEKLLPVVLYDPETGTWEEAPPVVNPDLAASVRARREEEAPGTSTGKMRFWLSPFGRCSYCGAHWAASVCQRPSGEYVYYRCAGRWENGVKGPQCTKAKNPHIRTTTVEAALLDALEDVARNPSLVEVALREYEEKAYANNKWELERDRILSEIGKLQRKISVFIEMEGEARAEGGEWQPVKAQRIEAQDAIKALRGQLSLVERQIIPVERDSPKSRAEKLAQSIEDVRTALTASAEDVTAQEKADALRHILERVDIDSAGRLVITFRGLSHIPEVRVRMVGGVVVERDGRASKVLPEQVPGILAECAAEGVTAVAARYGISRNSIYAWMKGKRLPVPAIVKPETPEECTHNLISVTV